MIDTLLGEAILTALREEEGRIMEAVPKADRGDDHRLRVVRNFIGYLEGPTGCSLEIVPEWPKERIALK